jgi:hypothetical protein
MRLALLAATILGIAAMPAEATTILAFGQTAGNPITGTANLAGTQTTIDANNATVDITQIEGGVATPAFLDLALTSTDAATPLGSGGFQHYSGSFSITSGLGGTGTNFLSGDFANIVLGVGPSAVLSSGSPPDTIDLTSDVIKDLKPPSAISLSFANLTPAFSIDNDTIGSFTSSVSGTFSATAVPEPAPLALLGVGLLGLGMVRHRKAPPV